MENIIETPAIVNKVSITGLKNTNHDFIKKQLESKRFFEARNVTEIMEIISDVHARLSTLDIFQNISISLDKLNPTKDISDDHANLHIVFKVDEKKLTKFSAKALCGLDNSVGFNLEFLNNNLFGRAEKLDISYHSDLKAVGGSNLIFMKPLEGYPQLKMGFGGSDNNFDHWWSKFLESSTSAFGEFSWKTKLGHHQCRFESAWREIIANSKAPLEINKENGDSMKGSFSHKFSRDTRDDMVYPSHGYSFSSTQEIFTDLVKAAGTSSGLANVNFKSETEIKKSVKIRQIVLENTLGMGFIKSLSQPDTKVPIPDRFFIGGPLGMRGFELRSIGPMSQDDNATPVGSNFYLQHGFHIYSPLPFTGNRGQNDGFFSLFRLHGFLTSATSGSISLEQINKGAGGDFHGNPTDFDYHKQLMHQWISSIRCTAGIGIIFKLVNTFRIELNYCVPLRYLPGDKIAPGFQFGIGILYI